MNKFNVFVSLQINMKYIIEVARIELCLGSRQVSYQKNYEFRTKERPRRTILTKTSISASFPFCMTFLIWMTVCGPGRWDYDTRYFTKIDPSINQKVV